MTTVTSPGLALKEHCLGHSSRDRIVSERAQPGTVHAGGRAQRIEAIDVVRGFALFRILMMN